MPHTRDLHSVSYARLFLELHGAHHLPPELNGLRDLSSSADELVYWKNKGKAERGRTFPGNQPKGNVNCIVTIGTGFAKNFFSPQLHARDTADLIKRLSINPAYGLKTS